MSKRNKTKSTKSGVSPWRRYNKRPYVYSPAYYAWFRETVGAASKSEDKRNG